MDTTRYIITYTSPASQIYRNCPIIHGLLPTRISVNGICLSANGALPKNAAVIQQYTMIIDGDRK